MSFPSFALGDVAEFIRGVTYKPGDLTENFSEGSVVCMRTANVQKELKQSDLLSIPCRLVKNDKKILREGDLLVSTANSWNLVGKCCWVPALDYPATAGGFIAVLRGKPEQLDQRYLYHWFSSPDTQADARNCGRQTTNISNMDIGRCLALEIPLPPLPEQRRIATILDKADALRTKRREAIAKLDQLLESVFLDMFGDPVTNPEGWLEAPLAKIVNDRTIVTYGIVQAGEEFSGGVPYIRTGDIVGGQIAEGALRHANPLIAKKFARSRVDAGDIVMSIRATVGTTAIVPNSLAGANLTQGTARIAVGENVDRYFALHHLRSVGTQRWIEQQVKGATFREITLGRLRDLPMMLPPRRLQDQFGRICHQVRDGSALASSGLSGSEKLFASLQHRAFEGTL